LDPHTPDPQPSQGGPSLMKRISYSSLAFAAVVALGLVASSLAVAQNGLTCPGYTPAPNSAVITPYVFGDCPGSTLTLINNYPALISINDTDVGCVGWTNLHVWSFSEDGLTPAAFENCSHYKFSAILNISGSVGNAEAGLRLSPWWSPSVDGRFMVNAGSGEIACFGGRLPFYSFTAASGLRYIPGTDIWLQIIYSPHSLTAADPATIVYMVAYQGQSYVSPILPFDEGNTAEGHGSFGELYPARVGGYVQEPEGSGGALFNWTAQWKEIYFEGPSATPASNRTWGQLKSPYR
jgi:hypothetical protein